MVSTSKTSTKAKATPKPPLIPSWDSFAEAVQEFIAIQTSRKIYNRATYFTDLAWIIDKMLTTSYPWFTESDTSWMAVSAELKAVAKSLGDDLQYSVEMGKLDGDAYSYLQAFDRIIRRLQGRLDSDQFDWFKSPTGQPLAIVEIVKTLWMLSQELTQECNVGEVFLLRPADMRWSLQAYKDLGRLYNKLGRDPLFDLTDFGTGGPNPWSGG